VTKKLSKKLSVIVPAYRESKNIYRNLTTLKKELDQLDREYEIVVVCDGCADTYEQAKKLASDNLKVYHYERNMGKGYALKYGADRTTGELVTFMDADMSIHPREIDIFTKLMDIYDADIVIGSKRHPQSKVHYPLFRRLQSFVYQMLIAILFRVNVKDTQTGLKLFKREVLRKVLPRVLVKAYAFDLELLAVAHHLGYKKVMEAPVEINYPFSSTVNLRSAWWTLWDTMAIFYRLYILRYYDRPHVRTRISKEDKSKLRAASDELRESHEDSHI
jgi:glycosyltransferase involved in cell wall biosynthesis